jgi:thiol:disulfide interchange protein DsbD
LNLSGTAPSGNTLQGILIAHGRRDAGEQAPIALELTAPIEPGAPLGSASTAAATALTAASFASYVLLAILGGLILNLMPCVFPVLSIKALGLVEQAKKHPGVVKRKGFAFAAGVIGSMLSLAAILLALRAGGEQIGWGFQLQSPLFVTMMAYLLFAVGLNLSGVFEVGGSLAGVGDRLTQGDGYSASFFTGVLTTLVATPCTAPFMGAAVGAALSQPAIVALAIFAALGLGLSLPYLLISFAPWLRKALPRPGAWMDTLKQIFAFPMYASAAWLLWVLAQQTSPGFLAAALAGAVLIGFAAWAYQKSSVSSGGNRWLALGVAAMALLIAIGLPLQLASGASARVAAAGASSGEQDWRAFDAKELAEMVSAGRPVLVNFTADWCLTCLVNERNALGDPAAKALFQSKGVALVKGDWTRRNPEITEALAKFGRAGVPLYVLYNSSPGESEPMVLPQLLTPGVTE